jgi:chlorophyllide a reductase subunit Y
VVPTREWRELYAALDSDLVAMLHPFYVASQREFAQAGRQAIGSAPVGAEGTAEWLMQIAEALNIPAAQAKAHADAMRAAIRAALDENPIKARITLSGYEGSELLVGRLLVESGADLRYVGTACPATRWNKADQEWLEAHGVMVNFRASLEQDVAAIEEFEPDLAVGTTPVVQHAKERSVPGMYFTNLISARPLMGPAGAGSLAQVINTAVSNRERFATMEAFFAGVGHGDSAGIWTPATAPRGLNAVAGGQH